MSIQIGVHDIINNNNIRTYNNERIKLYSDVQSNLLELVSGCNVTSFSLSNTTNNSASIHIGSSNHSSNIIIESHAIGINPYRIMDMTKEITTINTTACIFNGNIRVANNINIDGMINNNNLPLKITTGIRGSNVFIYAMSNDYKPFSIRPTTDARDIISLNTNSNNFIIGQPLSPYQPNVGIGTTIARYKLHTQGPIYALDGVYTKFISSNLNSTDINYYGNMVVNGSLTITKTLNLSGANFNVTNIDIRNTNQTNNPAIYVSQQTGSNSLINFKLSQGFGTGNTVFGVSPNGYTYIGTDLLSSSNMNLYETSSKSNAMLNIYLPTSFTNDSLIKTTSYDTSNTFIISKNAYIGIGTTIVRNPLDLCLNSNTNLLDYALSNNASIGIYHIDMPNKGIFLASSNDISVFNMDGKGGISIGSNNKIQLTSNGSSIFDNTLTITTLTLLNSGRAFEANNTYVLGLKNIQTNTIIGSNILTSNISLSNILTNIATIATSNINTLNLNASLNATFNDFYVDGALDGPTINIFVGQSDLTYFIPDARGENSLTYFKTSNVLVSTNSNYTDEITNAIAGNSNGILQVRTYNINNNPITPGISIYRYNYSSALVTSSNSYYQLQRPQGSNYQISVNRDNALSFGLSNGIKSLDYTTSYIKIDRSSTVSVGNLKTQLFSDQLSSIQVSTTGDTNHELESTGGFEAKGNTYLRTSNSIPGLYINDNAYVGIGTTNPKTKLDIRGNLIITGTIEIKPGIVVFNSNIGIGTTIIRKNIDILGDTIISNNIGIGTTLPRATIDIRQSFLLSGNLGIGTTNVGAYMLNVSSNMLITNSLLIGNRITAQNIYGKLNGIANSTEMSSNSPELIGPSSIVAIGTISCGTITNINTINVGIGTVNASTFIGSNMSITSLQPINGDIIGTTTGTIYATSSLIYGSNIPINQYLMINSNLSIRNQTGPSSSLNVYQSGSGSSYPVADFYDGDISTVVPALRIADGGNIGLGTTIPVAKLHVQGTGYFSTNVGIGTTLPIYPLHVEGGNVCFSSNIGIGIKTPLANLHVDGEIIIPELTGMVLHFATSNAPIGWLKCNGARVNRTSYSNLFARIGTTYGVGDGSTTFGIPDLRGVFIRGWLDDNRTVRITNYDPDRSTDFNSTIQTDDFKAHQHSYTDRGNSRTDGRNPGGPDIANDTLGTYTTGSTGGTETRPVNMALLACIKY